ncbi:hypothetical protein M231_07456 [Tremella mesenterica]|uniref:Uncharacterized protein n=1 Tax=Tremella mesenterica TaxID=5217 RepID=A0A4Q1BE51_TREME|nr:uncharacterized protein TREMEDRAFT_62401 [Tremella mesenterica DSM 1558]EIW69541.1 hypothetical protein TREMEDRAFT_62401 [Tremella mesenterica DSM 1558]RXK35285.1 hypothetical protein M231_07456 [Tremella mesenterica]
MLYILPELLNCLSDSRLINHIVATVPKILSKMVSTSNENTWESVVKQTLENTCLQLPDDHWLVVIINKGDLTKIDEIRKTFNDDTTQSMGFIGKLTSENHMWDNRNPLNRIDSGDGEMEDNRKTTNRFMRKMIESISESCSTCLDEEDNGWGTVVTSSILPSALKFTVSRLAPRKFKQEFIERIIKKEPHDDPLLFSQFPQIIALKEVSRPMQ